MMKKILILSLLLSTAAVFEKSANAQPTDDDLMLVLIDASGSMSIERDGDGEVRTRLDAAKALAKTRVREQAMSGLTGVSVRTFRGTSYVIEHTDGFVPVNTALAAIDTLDVTSGTTPLAGSMCEAIDALVAATNGTRVLQVSSDGEENSTPEAHPCAGPTSTIDDEPFTSGSWQNLVYTRAINNVIVRVDLFNSGPILSLQAPRTAARLDDDVEEFDPPTLEEFFQALARSTGGTLHVIADDEPLPIFADLNGDHCVNGFDAFLMGTQMGRRVPPADGIFDLNLDGRINIRDALILISHITRGC